MPAARQSTTDRDDAIKAGVRTPIGLRRIIVALGGRILGGVASCPNGRAHAHGDKHGSLLIEGPNRDEGVCHCRGCGVKGDGISLIRAVEGLGYRAALARAAEILDAPEDQPVSSLPPAAPARRGEPDVADDHRAVTTPMAMAWGEQRMAYAALLSAIDLAAPGSALRAAEWLECQRGIPLEVQDAGIHRALTRDECAAVGGILSALPDAAPACEAAGLLARTSTGGLRLTWCGDVVLLGCVDAEGRLVHCQGRMTDRLAKARYILPHAKGRVIDADAAKVAGYDRRGYALGSEPLRTVRHRQVPFGVGAAVALARDVGRPVHICEGYIASMAGLAMGLPAIGAGGSLGFANAADNVDGVHAGLWDVILGALAGSGAATIVLPDYDQQEAKRMAKFRDAKALSDYLHGSGLNSGPGIRTCRFASLDEVAPGRAGLQTDGKTWIKDLDDLYLYRNRSTATKDSTP